MVFVELPVPVLGGGGDNGVGVGVGDNSAEVGVGTSEPELGRIKSGVFEGDTVVDVLVVDCAEVAATSSDSIRVSLSILDILIVDCVVCEGLGTEAWLEWGV